MIEREFIKDRIKQMNVRDTINKTIKKNAGIGGIDIEKTPMGEKIVIHSIRPGMIIGQGGSTIKALTKNLKIKFKLENPQIETNEIINPSTNSEVVAKKIAAEMERFGPSRFKGMGYRELSNIINTGALGAEIIIKGKIPGKRSKTWRFYGGYMKKRGNIFDEYLDRGEETAILRSGTVGINVAIMHEGTPLPDKITVAGKPDEIGMEELTETPKTEKKDAKPKATEKEAKPKVAKKETKLKATEKPAKEVKKPVKETKK